jgi:hypothetical protein
MSRKPTNLTAHRNTAQARLKRALRDEMVREAKRMSGHDLVAYAIIGIDGNGNTLAAWDTGGVMPVLAFPAVIERSLAYDIGQSGIADDWKPSLEQFRGPKRPG